MIIYRNIGFLDMRNASEEALSQVKELTNIGAILLKNTQQHYLTKMKFTNVGEFITLPEDADIQFIAHNGDFEIDDHFFTHLEKKVCIVINGKLTIKPLADTSKFNLIYKIYLNGKGIVSSSMKSQFASITQLNGDVVYYDPEDTLIDNEFKLTDEAFWGFNPNTVLRLPTLIALEAIDPIQLKETFKQFKISEAFVATKENMRLLAPLIENFTQLEKHFVPQGYTYYKDLHLDLASVKLLRSNQLYVAGTLTIDAPKEALLSNPLKIYCHTLKIDEALVDTIQSMIERADHIKVIAQNTKTNMGVLKINKTMLDSITPIYLGNYGKITFEEDVLPEQFNQMITGIDNFGKITSSEALYPYIMTKVKSNYGVIKALTDSTEQKKQFGENSQWEDDVTIVQNISSLTL